MNFWDIGGTLALALVIGLVVVVVGGVLLLLLLRKMSGSPLGLTPTQVEHMLSQPPSLDFNLVPAPTSPVVPDLVNGLLTVGFTSWSTFFLNQSQVLTMYIATHPNGSVAVVYQHGFIGTWFEVHAQTLSQSYMWSSTPLFDENAVRNDVTVNHHRLLNIHTPLEEMAQLDIVPIPPNQAIEYLKQQHIKNEIHRLSVPLQSANVAALLSQTGETDAQTIQTIYHNAQAARWAHLEDLAWRAVGVDNSGETFVIHPYSTISEDIHILIERLQQEKVWVQPWDHNATHVPENFVRDITTAVQKSLHYTIVQTVDNPFPVVLVGHTI